MKKQAQFYRRAEQWLERFLQSNPVAATQLGEHRWDDRLPDYTPEALEAEYQELQAALAEFQSFDLGDAEVDVQIDHTIVVHILKELIRQYDKVQGYARNPGEYLNNVFAGSFLLIIKEFAPLPQRLRSALGRVREVPRLLREAQDNIVPQRVPKVWAEVALEQVGQAAGLFVGLLPAIATQSAPELAPQLAEAGQVAAQAAQGFASFLQSDVLPQAQGDYAAGPALFGELLRDLHMVDYDADHLLEIGWQQFNQTCAQMEAVARQIDPQKTAQELIEEAKDDHPTAEGLLDAYREAMASARRYVVEHGIVTIPEGESLRIEETPADQRMLVPYAAYMPPGILEQEQEGIFWVTPVDPHAPLEQQEQQLRGHYYGTLPVTALHEAYPGHHLQLVYANLQESIPRRMGSFLANLFIEGWAFYCEELMEQLGYIAAPIQRLGRLSDQLWRAARIVLDVSLHTRGMSVQEATDFLVRECQLEPVNALAEVRRYTQEPTQPQSYLMGKLALLDVVADYRRSYPEASLQQVHDAILRCGSLPPRLLRRRLFEA